MDSDACGRKGRLDGECNPRANGGKKTNSRSSGGKSKTEEQIEIIERETAWRTGQPLAHGKNEPRI